MPQGSQDKGGTPYDMQVRELIDALGERNVRIREGAAARLTGLAGVILRWNRAINLISRRDTARIVSYHFADSASVLPLISPQRSIRALDVGGSNGLPGLVLSSICPDIDLLICDSRAKRRRFLEEACTIAGPGNTFEVVRVDHPDFGARNAESFDVILARAVTGLKLLLKWCLPLLKPGGVVAAYKGSRYRTEIRASRNYFFVNGGAMLTAIGSPIGKRYNPLRKFVIAVKGD